MQKKSKNILLISQSYPFPQRCGFTYRVGDMCKWLSSKFSLHILVTESIPTIENLSEAESFKKIHSVLPVKINTISKILQKTRLTLLRPHFDDRFYENKFLLQKIKSLCATYYFHAVIVNTPSLAYCLQSFLGKTIKIIDAHDIWHQKYLNFKSVGYGNLLSQFRDKDKELNLYRTADLAIAISLSDLQYMHENGVENCIYVPPSFQAKTLKENLPKNPVLLYASGQGPLNIDAIEYFVGQVLPLVKNGFPSVKLKILNPSEEIRKKYGMRDDLILTSYTKDLASEYMTSTLVVVPLRFANGIKIKVLEAFAFKRPCIVSPAAIQGIQSANFAQRRISIDAKIFSEEILNALNDENYRRELAESGHQIIKKFYSPEVAYKELAEKLL